MLGTLSAALLALAPTAGAEAPPAFTVSLEQGGTVLAHSKREVRLRRAPFTIVLRSPDLEGAYLHAAFDSELFDLARQGLPFGNLLRGAMTVAESNKNADRLLFVDKNSLHVLDYTDKEWFYMEQVAPEGPGFRGRRTVEKLHYDGAEHPIAQAPARPLYLLVARGKFNKETGVIHTSEYEFFKLVFEP
jgi:hypothetical protein